jgi:microcystin-dependent protein
MAVLTTAQLKSRFVTNDKPSQKDYSDFIDTMLAASPSDAHINALIAAAVTSLGSTSGAKLIAQVLPPTATGNSASIWLKTADNSGNTIMQPYYLSSVDTLWHSKHPINPGTTIFVTDITMLGMPGITNGSTIAAIQSALASYDGGGSPGSGAMWTLLTSMNGVFPMGANPSVSGLGFQQTGGEASHTLTTVEIPGHVHAVNATNKGDTSGGPVVVPALSNGAGESGIANTSYNTQSTGGGAAHNNLPPFYAGYYIQRTTRTDYIVTPGT